MSLVDPRLLGSLVKFFPDRTDVQQLPSTTPLNAMNDPSAQSDWQNIVGLVSIPSRVSNIQSRRGDEIRAQEATFSSADFRITLAGYFPQIKSKMRLVVTRPTEVVVFDVQSVYWDGQHTLTMAFGQVIE